MDRAQTDTLVLFTTRTLRLFAFGFLSVTLALYLAALGFDERVIGFLFTLALGGDILISLAITTSADRIGRRRMLRLGAFLLALTGAVLATTDTLFLIALVAMLGVISPSGKEIGPFLSIEQAALAERVEAQQRTRLFAWYNLVGSVAAALGALFAGVFIQLLEGTGRSELEAHRLLLLVYAGVGVLLIILFFNLSPRVEVSVPIADDSVRRLGLHRSRGVVARLSALFALDAFAGGLIVQSLAAYWFHVRFDANLLELGAVFFGANILAGISGLVAARLAARIGLVETMVFTHIPSNVLLILVPFMPSFELTVAVWLIRASISQMDVPTRQSFTMAVVDPDERSAASGVTTTARSVGALLSPALSGLLLSVPSLMSVPFVLAGALKITYDLLLYRSFRAAQPRQEIAAG